MLNQSCRPIHWCLVRPRSVHPVQFAMRPGGTTKRMNPVKTIPIKESAERTEKNARQLNRIFPPFSITLPFSYFISLAIGYYAFFTKMMLFKHLNTIFDCICSVNKFEKQLDKWALACSICTNVVIFVVIYSFIWKPYMLSYLTFL